ncbi:NAD(P)/FAD-dependent oxidoreductase [Paracoccus salsus]|uniref:NAD(P)/FAD-dependent oxidoreductase n=1 Tax=Paracoccus salsus TaxID=2911061 RepID=UPI001F220147|nr:FAD-dependent oxidoreductase [Paracoccus salsus]MCF3973817.1 FAD-binding oxidoreductase [Paracoccus salsus]
MQRSRALTSITIIGGGIFGLSCGWEIARRGAAVRIFEARHLGAGASGGHVGALAPHAPENWNPKKAFQLDSLLMAPGFWAGVEAASGLASGYGRTGRIQPVPDAAGVDRLHDRIVAAARQWPAPLPMRLTDAPATTLLPASPTGLWLEDRLTARMNPRAAIAALAEAIRRQGGEIIEGRHVCPEDTPAGTTLWAAGLAGLATLSDDLGRIMGKGVKGQSALLGHAAPDAPQVFADGLHVVAHSDGTTAIGSTSENQYSHPDVDHQLDQVLARARAICPALADAPVLDRWAGIRPRAQSRAPLLGPWPGRPGHFVANGGFKIGFGMAPKIASVMADLILEGRDGIPDAFRLG